MAAAIRWPPATLFLGLWLLLGVWVSGEFLYHAAFEEKDRTLHLVVAAFGTLPILAVYLEWKRKVIAWGCLTICGVLISLYGAALLLSVGEEFGPGFFLMSIGFLVFGGASILVQILDWTFHR